MLPRTRRSARTSRRYSISHAPQHDGSLLIYGPQDGKPYIVYLSAGVADPSDPRTKGYTVISQAKFKTLEDMKFYDEACEAHKALKLTAQGLKPSEPPTMVYFEGTAQVDLTHA